MPVRRILAWRTGCYSHVGTEYAIARREYCRYQPCQAERQGSGGYVEEIGGNYIAVQLAALDNADPVELIDAPI